MGLLSDALETYREKKDKEKAYLEDARIRKMVEDRSKSINEKELEGYWKKQHEATIAKKLEAYRKKNSFLTAAAKPSKNQFVHEKKLFTWKGNLI